MGGRETYCGGQAGASVIVPDDSVAPFWSEAVSDVQPVWTKPAAGAASAAAARSRSMRERMRRES